jgi:hypothetical protein
MCVSMVVSVHVRASGPDPAVAVALAAVDGLAGTGVGSGVGVGAGADALGEVEAGWLAAGAAQAARISASDAITAMGLAMAGIVVDAVKADHRAGPSPTCRRSREPGRPWPHRPV